MKKRVNIIFIYIIVLAVISGMALNVFADPPGQIKVMEEPFNLTLNLNIEDHPCAGFFCEGDVSFTVPEGRQLRVETVSFNAGGLGWKFEFQFACVSDPENPESYASHFLEHRETIKGDIPPTYVVATESIHCRVPSGGEVLCSGKSNDAWWSTCSISGFMETTAP